MLYFGEQHRCKALLFLIVPGFGGLLLYLCNKGYWPTANTYSMWTTLQIFYWPRLDGVWGWLPLPVCSYFLLSSYSFFRLAINQTMSHCHRVIVSLDLSCCLANCLLLIYWLTIFSKVLFVEIEVIICKNICWFVRDLHCNISRRCAAFSTQFLMNEH